MSNRNFREMTERKWDAGRFVCVGLDSDLGKIPQSAYVYEEGYVVTETERGVNVANTIVAFNRAIVEKTKDLVFAYKPTAFYEAHGEDGIAALHRTISDINKIAPNVPVILDAKRADIGNTNVGYANFAFDYLGADAITVHPYLGAEALRPFLERKEKGIFVLCRTSNPGAGEFQDTRVSLTFSGLVTLVGNADEANTLNGIYKWSHPAGGFRIPLYQYVALRVSRHWNKNGNCALVVGATYPDELRKVRGLVGDMPILIPGIGAQGAEAEKTVIAGKDSRGRGMIVNSSWSIIFASNGADFGDDARRETEKLHNLVNQCRQKKGGE